MASQTDTTAVHFLIYGHRGWIGGHIVRHLQSLQTKENPCSSIQITLSKCRVSDQSAVESEIQSVSPTHIISTIGRTHGVLADGTKVNTIDYLESLDKTQQNVHDNLFAPMMLALLCIKHGIHFTYLGTGCIYHYEEKSAAENEESKSVSYNEQQVFTEEDKPNFFGSQYSTVKGFTDQLMQVVEYTRNVLNVRIRMPITDELDNPRNLIAKLVSYKRITRVPNSMSNLDELLPLMLDMALRRRFGTIHLVNPGSICHGEILKMYQELIDPQHEWQEIDVDELTKVCSVKAARSNNTLSTEKLEKWYPKQIKPIQESIRETLKRMKRNLEQSGRETATPKSISPSAKESSVNSSASVDDM
eukprot:CAMPEP_0197023986 /NCGR_PEP_ID=MMETSP1384-20130603/4646_1 /TAXON_ID=29189 /ORGANISM="Ammonia sp." /LENGTH=359 /DNA_ID=CAMNT_0042452307 /DNA_START=51 /DNA_END=1130 /DNA_ORIENTATION=-